MSYVKQAWSDGDVITEEKLNHIEDGIESADKLPSTVLADAGKAVVVNPTGTGFVLAEISSAVILQSTGGPTATLNASYNDVRALINANKLVMVRFASEENDIYFAIVIGTDEIDGTYYMQTLSCLGPNPPINEWTANSATTNLVTSLNGGDEH